MSACTVAQPWESTWNAAGAVWREALVVVAGGGVVRHVCRLPSRPLSYVGSGRLFCRRREGMSQVRLYHKRDNAKRGEEAQPAVVQALRTV